MPGFLFKAVMVRLQQHDSSTWAPFLLLLPEEEEAQEAEDVGKMKRRSQRQHPNLVEDQGSGISQRHDHLLGRRDFSENSPPQAASQREVLLPQIFPPVLEESLNSTSTERSTTVRSTSPATSEGNYRYITPENRGTGCPIRWDLYKGRCYFFSTNEENWNNSHVRCSNEGATLAIINNTEEQKFLQERAGLEVYFIGLRYQHSQKRWKWIDGSGFQVNFTNYVPHFDCATVGLSPTMDKSSCEISHRWICEKKAS
uniref:C-type lectin domain family 5 member A isoform X2 n=1 Tax=Phascolarctos cinereus TaxID=38626 RepID=A0A6P5L6S1_PHACI|nr:C-type lectin domain family 5 member A isoform X2 [Phascolarctos cinereus]